MEAIRHFLTVTSNLPLIIEQIPSFGLIIIQSKRTTYERWFLSLIMATLILNSGRCAWEKCIFCGYGKIYKKRTEEELKKNCSSVFIFSAVMTL